MKRMLFLGMAALLFMTWSIAPATAKDIVVNDGFTLPGWGYWLDYGSPDARYISVYDVTGTGDWSYCLTQQVSGGQGGNDGGLSQSVYVQAGVTYVVSADICYHNC